MASQNYTDLPVSSAAIVMVSPPMTQDGVQDVFHTPPEESSLHSSDNQQPTVTVVDIGVVQCTVNKAVDSRAGSQGFIDSGGFPDESEFVDLGKDSGLGFAEADKEQVAGEISSESGGDGVGEIPEIQSDQHRESVQDGEQMAEDEISDDEDLGSGKKSETLAAELGTETCDHRDDVYLIESDASSDEEEDGEGSGKQGGGSGEEPVLLKRAAADELKSGHEKKKFSGYDVLRAMAEKKALENKDEPNLLETARLIGITFPRPRWWPENDDRFASGMFLFEEANV